MALLRVDLSFREYSERAWDIRPMAAGMTVEYPCHSVTCSHASQEHDGEDGGAPLIQARLPALDDIAVGLRASKSGCAGTRSSRECMPLLLSPHES
jgi:hypothetical protein